MSASNPSLKESLNAGVLMRLADNAKAMCLGDVLAKLVAGSAADETALNPNVASPAHQITLSAVPTCVLDVIAVAGAGTTGRLALKIGASGVLPLPGEMVWEGPGSAIVRFNAGDAWTDVDIWYSVAADTLSLLERSLGQQDS